MSSPNCPFLYVFCTPTRSKTGETIWKVWGVEAFMLGWCNLCYTPGLLCPMLASGSEENMEPQQQMLFKRNIPIQLFRFQVPCWSSGCYWQAVFKSFFIQLRTYPSCTGLIIPLYQPKQRTIVKGKPCLFPIYWIYHLVDSHNNQTPHVPRGNASTNAWCWNFYVGLVESTDRFPSWQFGFGAMTGFEHCTWKEILNKWSHKHGIYIVKYAQMNWMQNIPFWQTLHSSSRKRFQTTYT